MLDGLPTIISKIKEDPLNSQQAVISFQDGLKIFFTKTIEYIQGLAYDKIEQDTVLTTCIKCADDFLQENEDIKKIIETYKAAKLAAELIKEQYDLLVEEARQWKQNPGVKDAKSSLGSPSGRSAFLAKAKRNAWILLQKQAAILIERLTVLIIKEAIKWLLDTLVPCKEDAENSNNEPEGDSGGLPLSMPPAYQLNAPPDPLKMSSSEEVFDEQMVNEFLSLA